jgi:hypothetical protein
MTSAFALRTVSNNVATQGSGLGMAWFAAWHNACAYRSYTLLGGQTESAT